MTHEQATWGKVSVNLSDDHFYVLLNLYTEDVEFKLMITAQNFIFPHFGCGKLCEIFFQIYSNCYVIAKMLLIT